MSLTHRQIVSVCISAVLLLFHSETAQSASSKDYPRGGNVDQFLGWATEFNRSGEAFRIEGICQSACTIFLRIRQVCVDPSATFRFHAGHNREKTEIRPYPTSVMFNSYNPALQQYLESRGAMKRLEFTDVPGSQIIKFGYRSCR